VAALAGGSSGTQGKSLVMVYNTANDLSSGYKDIGIYGDGTAGSATITIKSTSVTFANKSVTFYATSVASIAKPTVLTTVIGASASSTNLLAVAKDSSGNIAGSAVTLYAYSSDTTLASDNGSSCTFSADLAGHVCNVTGVKAGSPTFIVRDKSTVALSTVSSVASDAIRVSVATPATVKIAFNKATYAPNEKATITVSVLDSAGLSVAANTFANTLYPLNEFGPEGGFNGKYSLPGAPYPVDSNSGPYNPNDTNLDLINEFFIGHKWEFEGSDFKKYRV
jgi:hypothetical protein